MTSKQDKTQNNYMDRKPCRASFTWSKDQEGTVILEQEHKGVFHKIAQVVLKKPKITYIHLDETGSFIWPMLDGSTTVFELGKRLEAQFGEKASPLYPRLVKYLQILESYGFIAYKTEDFFGLDGK